MMFLKQFSAFRCHSGATKLKIVLLATILLYAGCQPDLAVSADKPPARVNTVSLTLKSVEEYAVYPARVQGVREVKVRSQVGGVLQQRIYREGQYVEAGQVLFRIDPEPYDIAVKQAEANLHEARAHLRESAQEWQRQSDLFQRSMSSEQAYDAATTRKEAAVARHAKAESALKDAQRLLGYADVTAPISGTGGMEVLSEGNLLESGRLLTTITQLDPVYVRFSVPSQDAMYLQDADARTPIAHVILPDSRPYDRSGVVNFSDVRVDPTTDQVAMRAQFPNPAHLLLPGQFVRVRLKLRQYDDVFLIDPAAVSEGPTGPQVYLVGPDDRAQVRTVKLGPVIEGQQVIVEGVASGEQLIVSGQLGLRDGAHVATTPAPRRP